MGLPTLPDEIMQNFIKFRHGYAVFATASVAYMPRQGFISVTPPQLLGQSFYYHSPAVVAQLRQWLAGRFGQLFEKESVDPEVVIATDLLMNVTRGHVGIIQFLGKELEGGRPRCTSLKQLRENLNMLLTGPLEVFYDSRCFGLHNGKPDKEQSQLISMLRCSGRMDYVDEDGGVQTAWDVDNPSHREGMSKAFYAPFSLRRGCISMVDPKMVMSFVHTLQPELFKRMCETGEWRAMSHTHRWVKNFSHEEEERSDTPTHVVDLVVSWLSHIQTKDLLYAHDNLDANETTFQRSFDEFRMLLGMEGRREPHVLNYGDQRGFLDLLIEDEMGVELLIRSSRGDQHGSTRLLQGTSTRMSLRQHTCGAVLKAVLANRQNSCAKTARKCKNGYVTMLLATLTSTAVKDEWSSFQTFIQELQDDKETAGALKHHIMVALAQFGWSSFVIFLHEPGKDPVKFRIPRQRLLFTVVDGQPYPARQFYPTPETVWVQQLLKKGSYLQLSWSAFEVAPAKDSVASLAEAVSTKCGIISKHPLKIYKLNHAGERWEWIRAASQVLYANTEEKPYGYYVSE